MYGAAGDVLLRRRRRRRDTNPSGARPAKTFSHGELHRFLPALAFIEGARITEVKVNHRARQFGSSKYGIDRTFRVLMDLLTVWFMKRFLTRPMYVFGFGGLLAIAASLITSTYLLVIKVMGGDIANRPLLTLAVVL